MRHPHNSLPTTLFIQKTICSTLSVKKKSRLKQIENTKPNNRTNMENGNAQSTQIFSAAAAPNLSPPNRQLENWTTSSTSDNSYQLDTLFRNLPHFQSFVTPSFWFSKNTTL